MMEMDKSRVSSSGCEIIGIAGNIGAGKSVVSRILRCNGFTVYDCDREASLLMVMDLSLRRKLSEILGEECYLSDGRLNKAYVSEKIFSETGYRERVNGVVHEAVREDFLRIAALTSGKVFVESAIMTTSGLDKLCDRIWIVDAPEDVRLRRVMSRNGMSEGEVRNRMESQQGELSLLPVDKVEIVRNDDVSGVLGRVLGLVWPEMESEKFEITMRPY